MKPWVTLATESTREGPLELRQRGDDFLITIAGRVLMNSHASGSEKALPRLGLAPLGALPAPRVLIGGLGMGITLRAALDLLPPRASVVVAELTPAIVTWCKGPLAALTRNAVGDPRVKLSMGDVAKLIASAQPGSYDAIVIDLYEGPNAQTQRGDDPLYGVAALENARRALTAKGAFSIWAEEYDAPFFKRFASVFDATKHMIGQGTRKHAVYVGLPRPPRIDTPRAPSTRSPARRSRSRPPRNS